MDPARRSDIAPFYVMEVMRAAEERITAGGEVLHLEVGQPSTSAPQPVLDAAGDALHDDRLGYTNALGVPELRARIARHYGERYGIDVAPERIAVTVGASGGCVLAFLAAFDPGSRVAVTEPGYPCYRNMLEAFGIEVVGLPIGPETRYAPTPDMLDPALDGIVVASPSNPTGTVLTSEELAALAQRCERDGIRLVSDEIYHGIEHTHTATSAASYPHAIVVQSFSKYYSMTGWRLGWLVLPEDLVRPIERLAQNLFISAPTLSQLAGLAAFEATDELDRNVERYRVNRDVLVSALHRAGVTDIAPADGAFYVYADVSALTDDSQELCSVWLDEVGVAATPGIDFDRPRGHRFVRFSCSESTDEVAEAARRLEAWITGRG
jgi:aspartate/methionine/tyrosine aminotransferase